LKTNGFYWELEIKSEKDEKAAGKRKNRIYQSNFLRDIMLKWICKKEMKVRLKLKGFGISIVDSEPREVLYMSVYKIDLEYTNSTEAD